MLSKKLIKSLVTPGKDEVCQAGAEKRPWTIICEAAEDDACKLGCEILKNENFEIFCC